LSAVLLLAGLVLIRTGRRNAHRACMISALIVSTLFLVSYVTYHVQAGTTRYIGTGWMRVVYISILLSHTVLAVTVPPLPIPPLSAGPGGGSGAGPAPPPPSLPFVVVGGGGGRGVLLEGGGKLWRAKVWGGRRKPRPQPPQRRG